ADQSTISLKQRRVLLVGNPGWPGNWYFRQCNVVLDGNKLQALDPSYDLIIGDQELVQPALHDLDLTQWVAQRLSLRSHWMVAWPDGDDWSRWLRDWYDYYWFRDIWPPSSSNQQSSEPPDLQQQMKWITGWPVTAIYPIRTRR